MSTSKKITAVLSFAFLALLLASTSALAGGGRSGYRRTRTRRNYRHILAQKFAAKTFVNALFGKRTRPGAIKATLPNHDGGFSSATGRATRNKISGGVTVEHNSTVRHFGLASLPLGHAVKWIKGLGAKPTEASRDTGAQAAGRKAGVNLQKLGKMLQAPGQFIKQLKR